MAEETAPAAEPSMEEILASIRKIISDENVAVAEPAPEPALADQDDVLELTQMVQEDGRVEEIIAVQAPEPPPPPPPPQAPPPVAVAPSEPLVSPPVANTAASALSSLANTVEIERLTSSNGAATYVGNGGRTLEDMTIELMRPLLKDWLDKNLPAIVERLVQKEIERIAHRS